MIARLIRQARPSSWQRLRVIGMIVIALIWALVAGVIFFRPQMLFQNSLHRLDQFNTVALSAVENWYASNTALTQRLASDPLVVQAAQELSELDYRPDVLNAAPAQKRLREAIGWALGVGEIDGYFLIDRDGTSLASSLTANTGTRNLLDALPRFLGRARRGETLLSPLIKSDVPLDPLPGVTCRTNMSFFVATPVRAPNGQAIAVFALRFAPEATLFPLLSGFAVGETSETYLVGPTGRMVSPSRFEEANNAEQACPEETTYLNKPLLDPTRGADGLILSAREAVSKTDGASLQPYTDYRGEKVIGVWKYSDLLGLGVVSEKDAAEGQELQTRIRILAVAIGMGLTLVALLIGTLLRREARQRDLKAEAGWLFESLGRGIFILDQTGRFREVNENLCTQFGKTKEELIGQDISVLDPELSGAVEEALLHRSVIANSGDDRGETVKEVVSREIAFEIDGETRVFRFGLTTLYRGSHLVVGGTSGDTTELHHWQEAVDAARIEAEANLAARTTFLQLASHELRTPLNAIVGSLSILRETSRDPQMRQLLNLAQGGTDDLLRTVEALENYVALTSENVKHEVTTFELQPALRDAIDNAASRFDETTTIPLIVHDGAPDTVTSDRQMVEDVTNELVANALAHGKTPNQSCADVVVHVRGVEVYGRPCVEISVHDRGPGLSKDEVTQAFQIFTRLSGHNTSQTRGVGLGLPLAQERAGKQNATLSHKPNPEGGAIFVLRLPLGSVQETDTQPAAVEEVA